MTNKFIGYNGDRLYQMPTGNRSSMTCSAIILAGGEGQRMGGVDKGLMEWRNKPLIQHVIERLAPQVDEIIISCNRNIEQYQAFGYTCIKDSSTDFLGPLAGIASCVTAAKHDLILLCPCDTPLIPENLLARLNERRQSSAASAIVASDGNKEHYSHALLTKMFAETAQQQLLAERKSLRAWFDTTNWQCADLGENTKAFMNINTLEQLTKN
ncbi:MAG: molybdopterin-guanine dinucleotide biosynthesis protein A [Pseudomonadales bacterium]|jgi:molybdopterin-guanine dinucleotide biosynthesis protein A